MSAFYSLCSSLSHVRSNLVFSLVSDRSTRPSDFSYKQDSQHNSTVVVSRMWSDIGHPDMGTREDITEDNLLHDLKRVLSGAKACKPIPCIIFTPTF